MIQKILDKKRKDMNLEYKIKYSIENEKKKMLGDAFEIYKKYLIKVNEKNKFDIYLTKTKEDGKVYFYEVEYELYENVENLGYFLHDDQFIKKIYLRKVDEYLKHLNDVEDNDEGKFNIIIEYYSFESGSYIGFDIYKYEQMNLFKKTEEYSFFKKCFDSYLKENKSILKNLVKNIL